jgi:hypothetical protein
MGSGVGPGVGPGVGQAWVSAYHAPAYHAFDKVLERLHRQVPNRIGQVVQSFAEANLWSSNMPWTPGREPGSPVVT